MIQVNPAYEANKHYDRPHAWFIQVFSLNKAYRRKYHNEQTNECRAQGQKL